MYWRSRNEMKTVMTITKALADANRVRVLVMLQGNELCVCQIIEMLGLAPSTVSKHMSVLQQADLVESRKEGRWIYYRRPDKPCKQVEGVLSWLDASLAVDSAIAKDRDRLVKIRCTPKEELCERYKQ